MLLLLGCGRSAQPLAPVGGQVLHRGQPLRGGTIVFTPDPDRGGSGPQAWAETDAEGRYRLRTGALLGAAPGWHRITVAACRAGPCGKLPGRYRDPERSGQSFEVKPDCSNTCNLNLD
jgi:hypothetical protein